MSRILTKLKIVNDSLYQGQGTITGLQHRLQNSLLHKFVGPEPLRRPSMTPLRTQWMYKTRQHVHTEHTHTHADDKTNPTLTHCHQTLFHYFHCYKKTLLATTLVQAHLQFVEMAL